MTDLAVTAAPADPFVFDSSALLAFLRAETGDAVVEGILKGHVGRCWVHAVNCWEVLQKIGAREGEDRAIEQISNLEQGGLITETNADAGLVLDTARLKRQIPHAALADCFCMALARRLDAVLVTADHPDFEPALQQGLVKVRFVR